MTLRATASRNPASNAAPLSSLTAERRKNPALDRPSGSSRAAPANAPMTTHVERHSYQLLARIPCVAPERSPAPQPVSESTVSGGAGVLTEAWSDGMSDGESTEAPPAAAALEGQETPALPITEPREGETVRLPDIQLTPSAEEWSDPIGSALTYNPTIAQGGAPPRPTSFGVTRAFTFGLSGRSVTRASGAYRVAATVDNPIQYQVRASTGPRNQLDISAATDADITHTNYASVARDLTPDTSRLNGKPPRNNFWSRSLTIKHERFHCTDARGHSRSGVTLAQNWLNGQTATSVAGVNTLLNQVSRRVAATMRAAMALPGREERAYGDGAPAYRTLATAIQARGDAGFYRLGDFPIVTPAGPGTAYA